MSLLKDLHENVRIALAEDLGTGDVTADLIDPQTPGAAYVVLKQNAIVCGQPWFDESFGQINPKIEIDWLVPEGTQHSAQTIVCRLRGPARDLLSGERTALNFLQLLSGTATTTLQYATLLKGTRTKILDTRKTIPGLRLAQKYAVRMGGGQNHRLGLYDQVLIKENHIVAAGSIGAAVAQARHRHPDLKIEVETENMHEFQEALASEADIIMLDNFNLDDMRHAVTLNAGRKTLEASGNVTLETLGRIAETGVDFISSGALTKDLHAIDYSMRFET